MVPQEILANPIWCLYDNTTGNIILKHPYRDGQIIPCPRCAKPLAVTNYRATCCAHDFKSSFGEIRQVKPAGTHFRSSGRGWESLRPATIPRPQRG